MDYTQWLEAALSLPVEACEGRAQGWDEWRGQGEGEMYLVSYGADGQPFSVQLCGQDRTLFAPGRTGPID